MEISADDRIISIMDCPEGPLRYVPVKEQKAPLLGISLFKRCHRKLRTVKDSTPACLCSIYLRESVTDILHIHHSLITSGSLFQNNEMDSRVD